jgi:hypothetical protein
VAIFEQILPKISHFLSKIGKLNEKKSAIFLSKIGKLNEKTVKNNNMTSTKFVYINST